MEILLIGLTVGTAAGISPGPLLTLVIRAALERGFGAGLRVSASPLLTDLPIIVLAVTFASSVSSTLLDVLTLLGGIVVLYLGFETLRVKADLPSAAEAQPAARDLLQGAMVNFLSPHPWIFWFGFGGPRVVAAWRQSPALAVGFLACFYLGLVGSKVVIAALVARGRQALSQVWYGRLLRICGWVLLALGSAFVVEGAVKLWPKGI